MMPEDDASAFHAANGHTSEQEKHSSYKTIKLNTCMAAAQYQPKKILAAAAIAF
jgi:hypothetical protein